MSSRGWFAAIAMASVLVVPNCHSKPAAAHIESKLLFPKPLVIVNGKHYLVNNSTWNHLQEGDPCWVATDGNAAVEDINNGAVWVCGSDRWAVGQ